MVGDPLIGIVFYLTNPSKFGLTFYISISLSVTLTIFCYGLMIGLMNLFGIKIKFLIKKALVNLENP